MSSPPLQPEPRQPHAGWTAFNALWPVALAVATGRSRSWLIAEALKSYVEAEKEFLEAVEEGIKAADEGRLVDHDAVVAEFERRYRSV